MAPKVRPAKPVRWLVGLAMLASPWACQPVAPPDLVLVNRTEATLVVGPGFIIPACSQIGVTKAEVERAIQTFISGSDADGRIPAGAVAYDLGAIAAPIGSARPTTVVITETGHTITFGSVSSDALPECRGRPSQT